MRSELWLRLRSAWWRIPSSRFRDPYAMTATLMQMSMRLTIAGSRSRTIRTEGSIDRSIERGSERASAAAISFFFSCPRSCLFENEIERARVGQTLNATSLGTHARAFCFPSTSPSSSSSATPSFRLAILSRRLSLFSNFLSLSLSFLTPPPPSSFRSSLHTRANVSHLGCRAVDNASRKPRSITIQTLIKPMHLSLSLYLSLFPLRLNTLNTRRLDFEGKPKGIGSFQLLRTLVPGIRLHTGAIPTFEFPQILAQGGGGGRRRFLRKRSAGKTVEKRPTKLSGPPIVRRRLYELLHEVGII